MIIMTDDFVFDYYMSLGTFPANQPRQLTELLTRHMKLCYTVIGMASSLFTTAELSHCGQYRTELNRRLLDLAVRRLQDQVNAVVHASLL